MKVFVSHHHSDAKELTKLKEELKEYNIRLFLAHADIELGKDNFHNEIMKEISDCDVFVLIANDKSRGSRFCNQEVGYALGAKKRKFIIAAIDTPLGELISMRHALKCQDMKDLHYKLRDELMQLKGASPKMSLLDKQLIPDLVIMNLLGSWQQDSAGDKSLTSKLTDKSASEFDQNIRACGREPNSPLFFQDNVWKVKDRLWLWEKLGKDVFDNNLDRFQQCARKALTDRRHYSTSLRKGIAETLALLGNRSEVLENCSIGSGEHIASIIVGRVLDNTDWVSRASLNDVLPLLAEAAPEQFINALEEALNQDPCPFQELFAQEISGIGGVNYLTGILWALEGLAWREEYLARVTILLGKLASLDPGGSWGNRPDESLASIFLPWFPQTKASWEKQKVAMQTLQQENPEVAWKTLLSLLPGSKRTSTNIHRPWSAPVPENDKVTNKEYRKQVSVYSQMVINMATEDTNKLVELVKHLDHLPPESLDELLEHIESLSLAEKERTLLWENLEELISTHKHFADAQWALPKNTIQKIETVANQIIPNTPHNLYRQLFNKEGFKLLREEQGDYEEQIKALRLRRQNAIKEIFRESGIDSVIQFAQDVKYPLDVGYALGSFIDDKACFGILKNSLGKKLTQKKESFIDGLIEAKYTEQGWGWVDAINKDGWSEGQKGQFLRCLPPNNDTWERVNEWLKEDEEYWGKITRSVLRLEGEKEFKFAIEKLLDCDRSILAIDCLFQMDCHKLPLPPELSIQALLKAVSSQEHDMQIESYHVTKVISALQDDPRINSDDLCKIEWEYLDILDYGPDVSAKTLEQKLASDPAFFHKAIASTSKPQSQKQYQEQTQEQKDISYRYFMLLEAWKIPPGVRADGAFSADQFKTWLKKALELCKESDHFEIGQQIIGRVLIHSPKDPDDPDGLRIHRVIAQALNKRDAEHIRKGLIEGFDNSRGAYRVDPTGEPEREFAEKYRKMANDVEDQMFHRLAAALRQLADSYDKEAEWNIKMMKGTRLATTLSKELDEIIIKGFKSIKKLESLKLNSLNVLIGANGAGKSNFIEIFTLLRTIINKGFQEYVAVGGGADGFLFNGPKNTTAIHCHFCFDQNEYRFELIPTADEKLLIKSEEQMYVPNGRWNTIAENSDESNLLEAKRQASVEGFVYDTISSWAVYHFHDTSINAPMRRSEIIEDHAYLRPDAANIAPFLLSLQTNYHREYQEIVEAIRMALPFFGDFLLIPKNGNRVKLEWTQKGNDYSMQPYHFSDGAIRFICLATALLQPDIPSTVVIDEPELGLHPEALALLAELIHAASKRTQVIVATQSPYWVDCFSVEDLIVVNRRDGQSVFERLDKKALSDWLEDYSVGELWVKNVIRAGIAYE